MNNLRTITALCTASLAACSSPNQSTNIDTGLDAGYTQDADTSLTDTQTYFDAELNEVFSLDSSSSNTVIIDSDASNPQEIDVENPTIARDLPSGINPDEPAIWPAGLEDVADIAAVNYQHGILIPRDEYRVIGTYNYLADEPTPVNLDFRVRVDWQERDFTSPDVTTEMLSQINFMVAGTVETVECETDLEDPVTFIKGVDGSYEFDVDCSQQDILYKSRFGVGKINLMVEVPFKQQDFGLAGLGVTVEPNIDLENGQDYTDGTEFRGVVSSGEPIHIYLPAELTSYAGSGPFFEGSAAGQIAVSSPNIHVYTGGDAASFRSSTELLVGYLNEDGEFVTFDDEVANSAIEDWSLFGAREFNRIEEPSELDLFVPSEEFVDRYVRNPWGTGRIGYIDDQLFYLTKDCIDLFGSVPNDICDEVSLHLNSFGAHVNIDGDFHAFADLDSPIFNRVMVGAAIDEAISDAPKVVVHYPGGRAENLPYQSTYRGDRLFDMSDLSQHGGLFVGGVVTFSEEGGFCVWANPDRDNPRIETFPAEDCPETWAEAEERANNGQ